MRVAGGSVAEYRVRRSVPEFETTAAPLTPKLDRNRTKRQDDDIIYEPAHVNCYFDEERSDLACVEASSITSLQRCGRQIANSRSVHLAAPANTCAFVCSRRRAARSLHAISRRSGNHRWATTARTATTRTFAPRGRRAPRRATSHTRHRVFVPSSLKISRLRKSERI